MPVLEKFRLDSALEPLSVCDAIDTLVGHFNGVADIARPVRLGTACDWAAAFKTGPPRFRLQASVLRSYLVETQDKPAGMTLHKVTLSRHG